MSECQNVGISECRNIRMSEGQNVRMSEYVSVCARACAQQHQFRVSSPNRRQPFGLRFLIHSLTQSAQNSRWLRMSKRPFIIHPFIHRFIHPSKIPTHSSIHSFIHSPTMNSSHHPSIHPFILYVSMVFMQHLCRIYAEFMHTQRARMPEYRIVARSRSLFRRRERKVP